jgi:hypothetical protein
MYVYKIISRDQYYNCITVSGNTHIIEGFLKAIRIGVYKKLIRPFRR